MCSQKLGLLKDLKHDFSSWVKVPEFVRAILIFHRAKKSFVMHEGLRNDVVQNIRQFEF